MTEHPDLRGRDRVGVPMQLTCWTYRQEAGKIGIRPAEVVDMFDGDREPVDRATGRAPIS
jgi:hypothetical protein